MDYISVCGFNCSDCAVYIATKREDKKAKIELAEMYTSGGTDFTPEEIHCKGCHSENEAGHKFCGGCEIKACAIEKKVANCGKCPQYPCEILEKYVPEDSDNRKTLDVIKLAEK